MTSTETTPGVKRYRKKPVEIEARLFDPAAGYDEACAVVAWCGGTATDDGCEISTLEGVMLARPGDWIIRGVVGEFYQCRGDVFAATYEAVVSDSERPLEEVIERYESGQPARDRVERAEFDHLAACADEPEDGAA